jgi:phage anti-repressor protein
MDTDCEKIMMNSNEHFETNSPDTLIEAKLAKIPKAFSIENLIAKKTRVEVENDRQDHPIFDGHQESFTQHRIPPIAFPQNFPFYHPWAANYLMSQTNIPPNLLLNANPQQLYQLQNEKLTNLVDAQAIISNGYKDKFSDLLFNSHTPSMLPHDTYLHQHPDPALLNSKFKDTNFLNEFYSNYFMTENNRFMMCAASDNNNVKRTKKLSENVTNDSCNNDSNSDFDVVNDDKAYEEDSSYSDLSVTMSPENHSKIHQDKGA